MVFPISSFSNTLNQAELLKGYWNAPDDACTCTTIVITPIQIASSINWSVEDGSHCFTLAYGFMWSKLLVCALAPKDDV